MGDVLYTDQCCRIRGPRFGLERSKSRMGWRSCCGGESPEPLGSKAVDYVSLHDSRLSVHPASQHGVTLLWAVFSKEN